MKLVWIKKFNFHLGVLKANYTEAQLEEIVKLGEFGGRLKDNDFFVYLNPDPSGSKNSYVADVRCWTNDVGVTYVEDRVFLGTLEEVMAAVDVWYEDLLAQRSDDIRFTKSFF